MKKIIAYALILTMLISFSACGSKNSEKSLYGTWNAVSLEKDGSSFFIDELKALDEEDYSDVYMIIKEGGKAYLYIDGYGDLVDWAKTEDGIMLGKLKCTISDGLLCIDNDEDGKLYLKKTSDSQIIKETTEEAEADDETQDETTSTTNTTVSTTDSSSGIDPEFKSTMDSYEKFFDEYISFMNKYKDSGNAVSMLTDYTKYMTKYAETMEKMDNMDTSDLSYEELAYYTEVTARISTKLAKVSY